MNNLFLTIRSLSNMIIEMNRKNLDLKRITKTASLLILSGVTPNSIPTSVIKRILKEQYLDGGWISIVDTMWNTYLLSLINKDEYSKEITNARKFLIKNKNVNGLWGRSKRDISRIPVSAIMLYLFPELNTNNEIYKLERLWQKEINSIVYKAGYMLMVFSVNSYIPINRNIVNDTSKWIVANQRNDGGFAPWYDHPADSDVFCTSIAVLGLLQYDHEDYVRDSISKACLWLIENRTKTGIWKYHEIEDGASWALYALYELKKKGYC